MFCGRRHWTRSKIRTKREMKFSRGLDSNITYPHTAADLTAKDRTIQSPEELGNAGGTVKGRVQSPTE